MRSSRDSDEAPHGASDRHADTGYRAVLSLLHRQGSTSVTLACGDGGEPGPAATTIIRVPGCLTEVPDYRFADLLVTGISSIAMSTGCHRPEQLTEHCSHLRRLFGPVITGPIGMGDPMLDRQPTASSGRRRVLDVTAPPLDRRGLLGLGARADPQGTRQPPHHGETDDDHARLLTSLRALGVTPATPAQEPPPAVRLTVEGCTACGVCVKSCPSEALQLLVGDTASVLSHHGDSCTGQQQCVLNCPVDAISVEGPLDWDTVLHNPKRELAVVRTQRCSRCSAPFPADRRVTAGNHLCEVCSHRADNPFGYQLPPGFVRPRDLG